MISFLLYLAAAAVFLLSLVGVDAVFALNTLGFTLGALGMAMERAERGL